MAERIPTELIEHIFRFAAALGRTTCHSISLVNKMGNKVATPMLYNTVGIAAPADESPSDYPYEERCVKLVSLCRTLLNNRSLAQHVTEIQHYCDKTITETRLTPPREDIDAAERLLEDELPLRESVREDVWVITCNFRSSSQYIRKHPARSDTEVFGPKHYLTLLVAACPRLKRLALGGMVERYTPAFTMLNVLSKNDQVTEDLEQPGPLIVDVTEYLIDTESRLGIWPNLILSILSSSKLRRARIRHLCDSEGILEQNDFTGRQSHIEELVLESCTALGQPISWLVSMCRHLKVLDVTWDHIEYEPDDPDPVFFLAITSMLQAHKIPLEYLRLKLSAGHVLPKVIFRVGKLRDLPRLHTLVIPDIALFGRCVDGETRTHDGAGELYTLDTILPESIKTVEIVSSNDHFTQEDRDILKNPGAERIENLTVVNSTRTRLITKPIEKSRKRSATPTELPGQPAARSSRVQ